MHTCCRSCGPSVAVGVVADAAVVGVVQRRPAEHRRPAVYVVLSWNANTAVGTLRHWLFTVRDCCSLIVL